MRTATLFILIGAMAFVIGLSTTWLALERGLQFNEVRFGIWTIWPHAGDPEADPYSRAFFARRGSVWMSTTEGLALVASKDPAGDTLHLSCTYKLIGAIPRARLWTLSAESLRSTPEGSIAEHYSHITSKDVVWHADKSLTIILSQTPYPGNWLQLPKGDDFQLILRLYDTPLTSNIMTAKIDAPALEKARCL